MDNLGETERSYISANQQNNETLMLKYPQNTDDNVLGSTHRDQLQITSGLSYSSVVRAQYARYFLK